MLWQMIPFIRIGIQNSRKLSQNDVNKSTVNENGRGMAITEEPSDTIKQWKPCQMPSMPLNISCSSKSRLVLPSWFYFSGDGSPG